MQMQIAYAPRTTSNVCPQHTYTHTHPIALPPPTFNVVSSVFFGAKTHKINNYLLARKSRIASARARADCFWLVGMQARVPQTRRREGAASPPPHHHRRRECANTRHSAPCAFLARPNGVRSVFGRSSRRNRQTGEYERKRDIIFGPYMRRIRQR